MMTKDLTLYSSEFLLSSARDHSAGLTGIKVKLDSDGNLTKAVTVTNERLTPELSDTNWLQRKFQQNIQRAAGNVVVEYGGQQYAFVADYNFLFNDVHFVDYENYGFGKQIGGKIGIVQDPFGKNGKPVYLGATSPIQGGAVDHLTLGADGTLYADVFMDEVSDQGNLMFKSLFVWNAAELIKDALAAQARGQLLSRPIDREDGQLGQLSAAKPSRYDGADGVNEFGWTYGIGSYLDPDIPVKVDDPTLRDRIIQLNKVEIPFEPLQTIEEQLNPNDRLVEKYALKGFDLLVSGGYFERYGKRVAKYNSGGYKGDDPYDQFVKANVADAMLTGFATVVTFGVGGKFIGVASKFESWAARVAIGGVAGGFAAGVTFDTLLQAGLLEVGRITNGVSGQTEFSWSHALTAGGFGAVLGGALGAAPRAGVAVYENAPRIVDNLLKKLGEVVGLAPSKSKTVISEAATSELSALVKVSTPKSAGAGVEVRLRDANVPELAGSTEILIKGKVVAITPAASSKTINEAAIWYRAELNKRASAIDKTLPLEAQIIQAETLAEQLMNGATASLFDKELAATLREAFARPSIEKLKNEIGGAGEKQLLAVLEKATAPTNKARQWFEAGACFIAGTLVHTKEGLVPIEKLKIGDWVLSRPENPSQGSELAYKRVLKTFVHHDKEIHHVRAWDRQNYDAGGAKFMDVYCTLDHPFWVDEYGWTAASKIPGMYGSAKFQMRDGSDAWGEHGNVYQTGKDGIVWMGAGWQGHGSLWNLVDQRKLNTEPIYFSEPYPELTWPWDEEFEKDGEGLIYKTTVYNIEVEDYHTYFVGEKGVWVHNANCDISLFGKNGQKPDPKLLGDYQHFASEKELIAFLKTNPESRGFAIVPVPGAAKYIDRPVGELKRNLVFEDGVTGRIDINGMRQEFAVFFLNSNKAPQARNYIRVEGQEFSQTGVRIFIDRKRELIKLDEQRGVTKNLDILWRVTQALEQNKNYRWAFEFEANQINGAEKVAFERAKGWLEKIKRNDADGPKFIQDGVVTTDSVDRLERIRKMLNGYIDETGAAVGPKIEFRNQGVVTTFPQNVLTEGSATTASLTLSQINALLPQARQYWLDAGASASLLGSASFQVDDLPTGLAGQSQGNVITLDASGAGWGWFVDSTPMDQAEFDVGTSATSFTSSTSSQATGKLDLLTVLIHELGHVVGLPSTATTNDVMSQYLAAGQRRLPDAVDIAALQAKGSPYYSNGTSVILVAPPANYGGSLSYSQLHPTAPVINPTLTNGNFTAAQNGSLSATVAQWETTGKVDIDSATPSTFTLGESTTAQAHLAQAFIITPQDRFLTFTVSGLALQTNTTQFLQQNGILTAAPQDAFEVALTNANTGTNLLTGLATDHSDALLNIQLASSNPASTVQERSTAGLRHTDNADGSRTYMLDLSGIAAGTPVNLSFDLIGFGMTAAQLGSHVSIKDVRLVSTPVAVSDTVTLLEDNSITINATANDLSPDAPGFTPKIVATAQHGQVSINANGTFGYTPEANFYGTDSFTYQYSNAAGEASNTATVTLSITPVNDAPVAADVAVTTLEDTLTIINLVAIDVDNTKAELQLPIQTQPTHGSLVKNANGSYSYTPAASFNGSDGFTYTVSDGSLTSNVATARITVAAVNDAPTLGGQALRKV